MVWGLRIYLAVYLVSFILSVVLGPRRGHSLFVSALGGFVLGPLNLLLIFLLEPASRQRRCPSCAATVPGTQGVCPSCGHDPG